MRETLIRCEKCAKREGDLVACKGQCGRFYHRLCLQVDCLGSSNVKREHICLACQKASQLDQSKAASNFDASSKMNMRTDKSSNATRQRQCAEEVDQYFGKKSGKKSSKSEGANDRIFVPSQKECVVEVKTLLRQSYVDVEFDNQQQFYEWSFALASRQSILLYGVGSKISVLTAFGQYLAQEGDVMSLNGYDPIIGMNALLDHIDEIYCDGTESLRIIPQARVSNNGLANRASSIARRIASIRSKPLFILIHNIDGVGLRNVYAQEAIANLTADSYTDGSPWIRIVASVDNVNAAMVLWSPFVEYKFDWVSDKFDVTLCCTQNATHLSHHAYSFLATGLEKGPHIQAIY